MPNANSVQFIPPINISQGPGIPVQQGKFGDAFIKALNIEVGLSESPTSISMGLIRPVGRDGYPDYDLSYRSPYYISLGNQIEICAYLIGQKKSTSSDAVTTQLDFVDGSHILDRIFVGGIGVHLDPNNPNFSTPEIIDESVPVICPSCYGQQIITVPDPSAQTVVTATNAFKITNPYPIGDEIPVLPMFTQRISRQSTLNSFGDLKDGGYIFLGDEKYTKTSCELPQIDYSEPANFARYGSAYLYYKSAFERIHDYYPYDGSSAEKTEFYNKSLDIEKYILYNVEIYNIFYTID